MPCWFLRKRIVAIAFLLKEENIMNEYGNIILLLKDSIYPKRSTCQDRWKLRRLLKPYTIWGKILYHKSRDSLQRHVLTWVETNTIISHCHIGVCNDNFLTIITTWKIHIASYFWMTLFKNTKAYCDNYSIC